MSFKRGLWKFWMRLNGFRTSEFVPFTIPKLGFDRSLEVVAEMKGSEVQFVIFNSEEEARAFAATLSGYWKVQKEGSGWIVCK